MDLKDEFGLDPDLAESGVWVSLDGNGTRIKIAAMPNPDYERYLEPAQRRFRQMQKEVPESVHEEAMAKHVLLDWQGIENGGAPLQPTAENRLAMIRSYGRFKALVMREATNIKNFQRDAEEAEIKN